MITIRPANQRGQTRVDWLDSRHSFSFNDYYDPQHMGFRSLRVINDDRVVPGAGFGTHGHRDMEIISYVLEGKLEHKDSLGHGSVLRPGEFQRMSAGTGVRHSEFNPSSTEGAHFHQIWLLPDRPGHVPSYEQKLFPEEQRAGKLRLVASPNGRDGSLTIHQDAEVFLSTLHAQQQVTYALRSGRHGWLQVLRGSVRLNDQALSEGDGAAVSGERDLVIAGAEFAEIMLFDLP